MNDAAPLVRQWLLLRTLSARRQGATLRELADEAGVSQKTARRDLNALAAVGFPLSCDEQARGRKAWRIDGEHGPALRFTPDEAAALYLSRRLLEPLAGTCIWEAAGRAFRKIKAHLGEPALRHLERLADSFYLSAAGTADYAPRAALIDDLAVAVEDRRFALLTYRSLRTTEPVTYEVHPYGFAYHKHALYLLAHSNDHGEVRTFKLDRVSEVAVQDLRFARPPGLTLAGLMADSFGIVRRDAEPTTVRIRFAAAVARYVAEHRWHPGQTLAPLPNGGVLLELRLSATGEVKRWLYGFGDQAEVLEPPELRAEMAEELGRMAALYRTRPLNEANPKRKERRDA